MERRPGAEPVEAHGWRVTSSRVAYENPWLSVREDEVIRPDGAPGLYGVVALRHPAVFVVALTDDDAVLMVELYRYATQVRSLEIPSGGADGDEPLAAARRELREETGHTAREWTPLGRLDMVNGVADAPEHVFLARGLVDESDAATRAEQALEGISGVRAVPWAEAMRLVREGVITDGETVAALMLAALHLGRVG